MECPACGRINAKNAGKCADCDAQLTDADAASGDASDPSEAPTAVGPPASQPADAGRRPHLGGESSQLHPGQQLGERYEILSVLGEGGCGIVYKAQDLALDRIVALKTIHPSVAARPGSMERFKREILLASKITHSNIVRIHDLGQADDIQFISMAFIDGADLKELIRRNGTYTIDEAVPLIRQLAEALRAAHDAGVVHRDLKPQNVLVDGDGTPYIGDFGISRSVEHGQTMTEVGAVLGTLAYMSPEQARGEELDPRSDIYSFGLILYEMFAGSLPFESTSAVSALMRRAEEEVPPIDATRADLPPWMSRIIARCLERKPEDRYQNIDEFLQDLDQQRARRARGPAVPWRILAAVAALIVIGALAVGGLRLWQSRPASSAAAEIRASLSILPFRNVTQDPGFDWVRAGLPELLRAELQQSESLRLAGRDRVRDVVEGLKLDRDGVFDADAVLELGRLTGVEIVLTGELIRIGDLFRIDAQLRRIGTASIAQEIPLRAEGQGAESLFTMVDELSHSIREELGLDRGWGGPRILGATELSTASVDALRLFSEGSALARAGSDVEAVERLEAALEVDPGFGTAGAALAEAYLRLGRTEKAQSAADDASATLSRVSPYAAARIRGIRSWLSNDLDAAEEAYREMTTLGPNRPEAFLAYATFQEETGEIEGALASLDRLIDLDKKNPSALFARGRVQAKRGEMALSIENLNAALALQIEAQNDEGRATVLNGLGNVYRILGEADLALRHYEESLQVREQIGDRRGVAVTLGNIALNYWDQGDLASAIESRRMGLIVSEEIADDEGRIHAYADLGDLLAAAGQAEEALEMYQQSLGIIRSSGGDDASLARAFSNLGYIYLVLGRYNEAFFFQKDALEKRRELGDKEDLLFSLMDLGNLESVQGHFNAALGHYDEGLGIARAGGNHTALIVFGRNIGIIHVERGEYGAALESLDEATTLARESDDAYHLSECLSSVARVRGLLGDHAGAEEACEESLRLARDLGSAGAEAEALIVSAGLLRAQGRDEEAGSVLQQALEAAEKSQDHRTRLLARLAAAEAAASVSDLQAIAEEARRSELRPLQSAARLALARVHLAQRRPGDAASEAARALDPATELRQRDAQFEARRISLRALRDQNRSAEAVLQALTGLDLLVELRRGLSGETLGYLLERDQTVRFGEDAEAVLQAEGRNDDLVRLRDTLSP